MSSSSMRPMRSPNLDLATVVTLSTMIRLADFSPLWSFGSMARRNRGASVGSVVSGQIVIEHGVIAVRRAPTILL